MLKIFKYKKNQLVPLKYFADKNLYQTSYLSVLVQRKKLKAKKVGRIYYTTQDWFIEYLTKHAQSSIREGYAKLFKEKLNNNLNNNIPGSRKGIFFSGLNSGKFQVATFSVAVLILLTVLANLIVTLDSKRGVVSGIAEEAKNTDVATSTDEVNID